MNTLQIDRQIDLSKIYFFAGFESKGETRREEFARHELQRQRVSQKGFTNKKINQKFRTEIKNMDLN